MRHCFKRKPKYYNEFQSGIVIKGDCLKSSGIPAIKDKSVSMVLCDLPYGTTDLIWDRPLDLNILWKEYKRVLVPGGSVILFSVQPFTTILVASNKKAFKYEWVWIKNLGSDFLNAKYKPIKIHENILVFSLSNERIMYNAQGIKDCRIKRVRMIQRKASANYNNKGISPGKYIQKYTNYPTSVLFFNKESNRCINETQKPIKLCEYLIRTYSDEGDVVLDNTAGSFTTAIACIKTNRKFICIEKRKSQYKIGIERIRKCYEKEGKKNWWNKI